jgi:hypothetical protein
MGSSFPGERDRERQFAYGGSELDDPFDDQSTLRMARAPVG